MKKILIISYNFAPRHTVGAIRPTKLALYLGKDGYEVDVVCVKPFGTLDHSMDDVFDHIHHIDEIGEPVYFEKTDKATDAKPAPAPAPSKSSFSPKDLIPKSARVEYTEIKKLMRTKNFVRAFKELIESDKERFASYDAYFSTFGPVASHACALEMHRMFPDIRWIADFRDPMVSDVNDVFGISKLIKRRIQNKTCKYADRLVAVSHGYYERIFDDKYKDKASVIYNGFDRGDVDLDGIAPDGKFSFVYVGNLYDGKRDLSVLFEVLAELCDEGKIAKEDIVIKYAGTSSPVILRQAAKSGLENNVTDYGKLPRKECLELQAGSRHLVLSTWNDKGEEGVFPGKFLEYIMMGKPIVSLVAGELPNAECTRVMKKAGLGISYEEASKETDRAALKEYILNDYNLFRQGKMPDTEFVAEEIEKFDFSNVAKQIEGLF